MVRVFTLVAAAIAVAALVGLAVLWPGEIESQVAQGIAVESEPAKVDTVREGFCAGFATQQCQFVRAEIESGAEEGKRIEIQLGGGGLDPTASRRAGSRPRCPRRDGRGTGSRRPAT